VFRVFAVKKTPLTKLGLVAEIFLDQLSNRAIFSQFFDGRLPRGNFLFIRGRLRKLPSWEGLTGMGFLRFPSPRSGCRIIADKFPGRARTAQRLNRYAVKKNR